MVKWFKAKVVAMKACCPNLQIQGDRQVLTFRNNATNLRETWVAISKDAGLSFASAKPIDTTGWIIFACPSTGPDAVLKGNELTTVFMSAATGKSKVYISESDITGFGIDFMSKLKTTDTVTAQANYVRIAGGDDVIAAVWQYTEWGDANIYFSVSNSGASAMVDNYDTVHTSTAGLQQSPDIAYADGVFHIVWRDLDSGVVMYRTVTVPFTPTVGIEEEAGLTFNAVLSPNPFNTSSTLQFDNPNGDIFELRIYDITGRLQQEYLNITSESVEILAKGLSSGTYVYLLAGKAAAHHGKLTIQ